MITPADAAALELEGVAAVYGPGTNASGILESIKAITSVAFRS